MRLEDHSQRDSLKSLKPQLWSSCSISVHTRPKGTENGNSSGVSTPYSQSLGGRSLFTPYVPEYVSSKSVSRTYSEIANVKRENSATLYSMDHLEDIWLNGKSPSQNQSVPLGVTAMKAEGSTVS